MAYLDPFLAYPYPADFPGLHLVDLSLAGSVDLVVVLVIFQIADFHPADQDSAAPEGTVYLFD